jgi:HAE1 family hydrophobic/amphiphilic exporter-1
MNPAELSLKRPIFITCIVILLTVLGLMGLKRMPVDLFPNVTFPVVMVSTVYPGAGPLEVETLVSKVLEDDMSTLPGLKSLRSINQEGVSTVVAEFNLKTDIKDAQQQVRDRVSSVRYKLPKDIKEPVIRRIDPADQPIAIIAVKSSLSEGELYDLTLNELKPKIEQIPQVGMVEITGGRKREIHVSLDRSKLKKYEISSLQVAARLSSAGQNVPAGKVNEKATEVVFRTLGEFTSLKDIGGTIVNFLGNDVPVTLDQLGTITDDLAREQSRSFVNGEKGLFLMIFRQSGANTIEVVEQIQKRVMEVNAQYEGGQHGALKLSVVRDGAKMIKANVDDVKESIIIGMLLTFMVVYLFLGNGRSTFITGLAIPNSLIGAFLLMSLSGFTINVMSLLALSLAVGLLIDDAIVVRENIFRHIEMGEKPPIAALKGTKEVMLAVIATTMTVVAVFGPIGFLNGVVGQFFKEFGLTVCYAMAISLFDALTIAPMLSAYFAGSSHSASDKPGIWGKTVGAFLKWLDHLQTKLENYYAASLGWTLKHSLLVLFLGTVIFMVGLGLIKWIPKTFLSPQDNGEFSVTLEMKPGTTLDVMSHRAASVDKMIRNNSEVYQSVMMVGGRGGEGNVTTFFINLVPRKERKLNTILFKQKLRDQLKQFSDLNPVVKDIDMVGGGQRPFILNIIGTDLDSIQGVSQKVFERLRTHKGLLDVESSDKPGRPEFQVELNQAKAQQLGVTPGMVGMELRTQVEGTEAAVYREKGQEYTIRVNLLEDQKNLRDEFERIYVPNINYSLVKLSEVAKPLSVLGPTTIYRQDRGRYIQISADITPDGPGMGGVMSDVDKMFKEELKLPPGVRYSFVGQAENFQELGESMITAALLGILFIYFVLASLYESFVTPFTIMLVLPLAACGAFYALFLTKSSLDLFSMIGCIMLLGVATKNSILLVDYTLQLIEGENGAPPMNRSQAIILAGKTRLRPILMTSVALIAGMLPVAIGLNEASKQRTSMGIAIIGGLISSTLLTLFIVPAAFSYIDRFRLFSQKVIKRFVE